MTVVMNRGLDTRAVIPWIAAAALAVLLVITLLSGTTAIVPRSSGTSTGPAEVATNPVPAYVQEGIVYGELAPGATSGAEILPAYMVESRIFGDS
jgi:hypothetical protein